MNTTLRTLLCAGATVAVVSTACVEERNRHDMPRAPDGGAAPRDHDGEGGEASDAAAGGELPACEEGTEETCVVYAGEQGGRQTCFEGVRRCREGRWGACRWVPGAGGEG